MAEVLLSTLADALGGPVVADATFTATASRARAVGDGVVANKTITVSLVQGVPSEPILLDQSGVDWCWRLRVVFPSIGVRIDRTVDVPDVPSVEWADLVDVDPATLLPAESAVPAWTAAVGQVAAALADTNAARDQAGVSAGIADARATDAEAARVASEAARAGSEAARDTSVAASTTATTKAAEASADAAAAEAARDLALAGQFAGAAIGAADLNTIITPGVYRQGATGDATLVRNYPVAAVQGVLEVFHSTATSSIFQRYMQTTGTASGKGHWQRRYTSSAWSAWGFVATQRVDQTAGRAIYTWDDVNNREQLIWGDTGVRGVTASIPQITSGNAYIRRTTNSVEIILEDVVLGTLTGTQNLSFPSAGFKPPKNAPAISYLIATPVRSFVTTACVFRLYGVTSGGVINAIATYSTNEPWPSVNP